jgi:hypothetical protein
MGPWVPQRVVKMEVAACMSPVDATTYRTGPVRAVDPGEVLEAARRLMSLPVGGDTLVLASAALSGRYLELVFTWNDLPGLLGVRIEVPDTTAHPAWQRWEPQTVEEWVQYAIRVTLPESA